MSNRQSIQALTRLAQQALSGGDHALRITAAIGETLIRYDGEGADGLALLQAALIQLAREASGSDLVTRLLDADFQKQHGLDPWAAWLCHCMATHILLTAFDQLLADLPAETQD